MFTGIVEEVGRVARVDHAGDAARVVIDCSLVLEDTAIGGSIAVNGCCVTVTERSSTGFVADLMAPTLRLTALGQLRAGSPVNLERPLALGARLGGHLVQGHVDAVGRLAQREELPGEVRLTVAAPSEILQYVVPRGSITIQGVSLTVLDVAPEHLRVALIPHTLAVTTLGAADEGDPLNLEVDVIAKYVERLVAAGLATPYADQAGVGSPSGGAGATMQGPWE